MSTLLRSIQERFVPRMVVASGKAIYGPGLSTAPRRTHAKALPPGAIQKFPGLLVKGRNVVAASIRADNILLCRFGVADRDLSKSLFKIF